MKKILGSLVLVGLCSFAAPAKADHMEVLSCSDLSSVANDLTYIANQMDAGISISEGSDLDYALADVVDALYLVADSEHSDYLYYSVEDLDNAWINMDRYGFVDALDAVVDEFDDIYDDECN